jgi:hypothetical protein
MSHPLVLALYPNAAAAAAGVRAVHRLGVARDQISVVARTHDEEGALAEQMDATPGVDIEDSRLAARLGELSGHILAAIALVMPGIGPLVTAGPLAAGLGEAAGHVAGSVASVLARAGVPPARAEALEHGVHAGSILIGIHAAADQVGPIQDALRGSGALSIDAANWTRGG